MARIATTNLSLGTWAEGENPGAGSQTVQDNAGLNHNWLKLDAVIGAEHGSAGTHNNDVIGGASIKNTIVDGTTLVASASTGAKTFGVATGGIGSTQLASGAVTSTKLGSGAVDATALGSSAVTEAKINAGAVTNTKLGDDAVTSAKISHDNTRTKVLLTFSMDASTRYGYIGHLLTNGTTRKGIPMTRAGAITALSVVNSAGTVYSDTAVYSTGGGNHFSAGALITVRDDTVYCSVMIGGVECTDPRVDLLDTTGEFAVVEIEFDD